MIVCPKQPIQGNHPRRKAFALPDTTGERRLEANTAPEIDLPTLQLVPTPDLLTRLPPNARCSLPRGLAITDEASPFALRSTRNSSEDSSAPGRRLARGAAEEPAGSGRAQTRLGAQRAVARRGGQGGPDAGCAVVTVSAFLSGVWCERPVSRGACPSDRCPVRASECPGVQCPASGVCCVRPE